MASTCVVCGDNVVGLSMTTCIGKDLLEGFDFSDICTLLVHFYLFIYNQNNATEATYLQSWFVNVSCVRKGTDHL